MSIVDMDDGRTKKRMSLLFSLISKGERRNYVAGNA